MRRSVEHPAAPPRPHRYAAALAALLPLLLLAPVAGAEVEIVVRPDGTRVVRNVGGPSSSAAPARRTPTLRAAPRPELRAVVAEHAAAHDLDPRLVEAVIQAESAWNRRAVSRAGAMGLMQLMPETAVVLAVDDPWDERQNVRGGTAYLARLLARFGSEELALAAYNAGPSAVERYGGIPPYAETREYVRRVLSLYHGRHVGAEELVPFHGRGAARSAAAPARGGTAPTYVRGSDGRLVLTNSPSPRPAASAPPAVRTAAVRTAARASAGQP